MGFAGERIYDKSINMKKDQQKKENEEKKVRMCFGKWGEKEEKLCKEDCNNCFELTEYQDIIFCKKKKTYPGLMMCGDIKKCQECYWNWWFKHKKESCSQKEEIRKFMEANDLKFEKRRENREEKKL